MTDIIILAAGTIKNKIHFLKYTYYSPALIPINTDSLSKILINYYLNEAPKSYIHLIIDKAAEREV